jgi:hypothetical protein
MCCCTAANARRGKSSLGGDDPALRRGWRRRLVDHDRESEGDGGIARWLKLTDELGLDRNYVVSLADLLPSDAVCGRGLCTLRPQQELVDGLAKTYAASREKILEDMSTVAWLGRQKAPEVVIKAIRKAFGSTAIRHYLFRNAA